MFRKIVAVWVTFSLLLITGAVTAQSLTRGERAEMRFLEGMIDHHQMALDMADDCLQKASTESVVTVCENIIEAQTAEIDLMQGWLLDWYNIAYEPVSMMGESMLEDGMGSMGGMQMPETPFSDPAGMMGMFAGFNQLEGVDYEIAWLESMIDHHDDAIHMSERVLTRSVTPELSELAEQIITDQTAEIDLMESLLTQLAG